MEREVSISKGASVDKAVLRRLAQFILNRSTENIRNELYEYLIMSAIYDANKDLTKEEIISAIEKELGVAHLPPIMVDGALARLTSNKSVDTIQIQEKLKYFLSLDAKEKFSRMTQEHGRLVSTAEGKLIELVGGKYGPLTNEEKEIVLKNFRTLLGVIFSTNGFITANAILGKKEITKTRGLTEVSDLITKILDRKDNLSGIQKEVFLNYLCSPDESLSAYLYSLAQSYFLIEILNLDPECQALLKENISKKVGYLDTNVIVGLFGGGERQKAAENLIKLTTDLGIKLKFTEKTKEEFTAHVRDIKRMYQRAGQIVFKNPDKMAKIVENGFLKDYLEKKQTNSGLSYDGYFAKFGRIEALLKDKYSIEIDNNLYEEIKTHEDMEPVKKLVINYCGSKNEVVAEHDAYHILLIQDLRKKEKGDMFGPNSWFITCDSTLYYVDRNLTKKEPERIPSSIHAENWIQMISPLLSPETSNKTAKEVFIALFASRLPVLTKAVKEEDLLELQGTWMDDEDLSPEEIARIIGDNYVRKCLEDLRKAQADGKEVKISEIISPVIGKVKKEMGQKYDAQIKTFGQKYDAQINELKQGYDTRIKTLEETIKRFKFVKPLFFVGLACVILIVALGVLSAYQKVEIPYVVYISLTTFALSFILASFFGKSVLKMIK